MTLDSTPPRSPQAQGPKRRACDECRSRKLSCSKEVNGCSRCKRDGVRCHYSQQKPMGRPRKANRPQVHVQDRREESHAVILPTNDSAMDLDLDLDLDLAFFDMNDFSSLRLVAQDSSYSMNTSDQLVHSLPKEPLPTAQSPTTLSWQMFGTLLGQEINFGQPPEPQPPTDALIPKQALDLLTSTDIPDSLPSLSPQTSSSLPLPDYPSPERSTTCSCLASLYLALDSLKHLSQDVPTALCTTRSASRAAYNAITCPICSMLPLEPSDPHTHPPLHSFQALMMLGALLPTLSNAYKTILSLVDAEAASATASSRQLTFDLSSYGGLWGSLAVASGPCGAADKVSGAVLDPTMWRLAVRALLKVDVYGFKGCAPEASTVGNEGTGTPAFLQLGLKDIIAMMEERSRARHEQIDALVAQGLLGTETACGGEYVPLDNAGGEKPTCLRIIGIAKRSMQSLDIP